MKKYASLIIGLGLLTTALVLACLATLKRIRDHERAIIASLSRDNVRSAFVPVMIYRIIGNQPFFAGSGSLFTNGGTASVISCEHIFGKVLGNTEFSFRRLRPFESEITNGLAEISFRSEEIGLSTRSKPDVVVLEAGKPKPIKCFSERLLDGTHEHSTLSRTTNATTVKSLVTGRSSRVVGTLLSPLDGNTQYSIIEYEAHAGESGTGFVDENDDIYVLKAILNVGPDQRELVERTLRTSAKLSLAYGPMRLRK